MCGPLTCMLFEKENAKRSIFIYHFSRLLSYSAVVFMLTIIGSLTIKNMIWDRFSYFVFWALIAFVCLQLFKHLAANKIKDAFPKIISSKKFPVSMGMITGLLPCGLLIPAYIGASSMPSKTLAITAIFIFFAGTIPALLMSQTLLQQVKKNVSPAFHPWINSGLGILFLLVQVLMFMK